MEDAYELLGAQIAQEALGVDNASAVSTVFDLAQAGLKAGEGAAQKKWGKKDEAGKKGGGAGEEDKPSHARSDQGSFFTTVHGGIPTWGWMVGGAGILTGVILLLRRRRR